MLDIGTGTTALHHTDSVDLFSRITGMLMYLPFPSAFQPSLSLFLRKEQAQVSGKPKHAYAPAIKGRSHLCYILVCQNTARRQTDIGANLVKTSETTKFLVENLRGLSILNAYILRASRQLDMLIALVETLYCTVR